MANAQMDTLTFLTKLWPDTGIYCIAEGPHLNKAGKLVPHHHGFDKIETAVDYTMSIRRQVNVWFNLHTLKVFEDEGRNRVRRLATNTHECACFYSDLDVEVGVDTKYPSRRDALQGLKDFIDATGLPWPMVVSSGYGLHIYWCLTVPIDSAVWVTHALNLRRLMEHHGLKADHQCTTDRVRLLRVVGTFNRKNHNDVREVKVKVRQPDPIDTNVFIGMLEALMAALPAAKRVQSAGTAPAAGKALPETQGNIAEEAEVLLEAIDRGSGRGPDRDIGFEDWRRVVWGLMATGLTSAKQMARAFSERGSKWDEGKFDDLIRDFKPDGGTGPGTLVHIARKYGYDGPGFANATAIAGAPGDIANGRRFADSVRGRLLWIHDANQWLRFDPVGGWSAAPSIEVEALAKAVVDAMALEASRRWREAPEDAGAKKALQQVERTSRLPQMQAMIDMAKSEPGISASLAEFDADPMTLGVRNGVLDLRTSKVLPFSPEMRVSKKCAVAFDPDAACPLFETFLAKILPDAEVRAFLRRFIGQCLTGRVDAQVWAFLHGSGANGKSVLVETLAFVLGDYARKLATETLMDDPRGSRNRDPDILALRGARLAFASETEEGRRLSEARVKELTGGDTVTARAPYAKAPVSISPVLKLIMVGNHRPVISDTSLGMWRRIVLIEFRVTISEEERDPDLARKLRAEASGILNWALSGLREWLEGSGGIVGLRIPATVRAATADYQADEDLLGQFLEERCDSDPSAKVVKEDLYDAFSGWCLANGRQRPPTAHKLTRQLRDRGFKIDGGGKRYMLGLRLKGGPGHDL